MMFDKDLMPKKRIYDQIEAYLKAVENIKSAYALLSKTQEQLNTEFPNGYYSVLAGRYTIDNALENILLEIKKRTWRNFVHLLGIEKILSIKKAEELDRQLEDLTRLPEITHETVYETLRQLAGQAGDFSKDACVEVFNYLRPYNHYKTNLKWQIGKKAIISNGVERYFLSGCFHVNYYRTKYIIALDNVFHSLDGKGIPGGYHTPLVDAIQTSETGAGETTYFKFHCYQNGNLHIEFKRLDLVKELNRIGGDGTLPGAGK